MLEGGRSLYPIFHFPLSANVSPMQSVSKYVFESELKATGSCGLKECGGLCTHQVDGLHFESTNTCPSCTALGVHGPSWMDLNPLRPSSSHLPCNGHHARWADVQGRGGSCCAEKKY